MGSLFQSAGDLFIWLTSIVAGCSALYGAFRGLSVLFTSAHDRALLGDWFQYGFFQTKDGPHFYKERVKILRRTIAPWQLVAQCQPVTAASSTSYRGLITSRPPFLYITTFDPVYHDRTFEILRRIMDSELHDAGRFVGIHLGKSYEQNIHTGCAVLLTRKELDPEVSSIRAARADVEQEKFLELIKPYFKIDRPTYQLLMV